MMPLETVPMDNLESAVDRLARRIFNYRRQGPKPPEEKTFEELTPGWKLVFLHVARCILEDR